MSSRILRVGQQQLVRPAVWQPANIVPAKQHETCETPPPAEQQEEERINQRVRAAYDIGYRDGQEAGKKEVAPMLSRLVESIETIMSLRPSLRHQAEKDLVQLAVAIARRILRREITLDQEALLGLVKAAFEKLAGQEISSVRVHPDHASFVRAELQRRGLEHNVTVIADPALEPGDLQFTFERGSLDASINTQLAEIERGLVDRLGKIP